MSVLLCRCTWIDEDATVEFFAALDFAQNVKSAESRRQDSDVEVVGVPNNTGELHGAVEEELDR